MVFFLVCYLFLTFCIYVFICLLSGLFIFLLVPAQYSNVVHDSSVWAHTVRWSVSLGLILDLTTFKLFSHYFSHLTEYSTQNPQTHPHMCWVCLVFFLLIVVWIVSQYLIFFVYRFDCVYKFQFSIVFFIICMPITLL